MKASISEIKKLFDICSDDNLLEEIQKWKEDERKGVKQLVSSAQKRLQRYLQEEKRMDSLLCYERLCYKQGYTLVAGIDEVGRGPLAGPVMTAAVILPKDCKIPGVDDSKKLSAKKRELLYEMIMDKAIAFGFGSVSAKRIDEINILRATFEAMEQAISKLTIEPEFVLADAVHIPNLSMPQQGIIKGDAKSMSIGAASIIAKVERDKLMTEMHALYPEYGFCENKGYGTQEHVQAIKVHGLCPIHRLSFVKNIVGGEATQQNNREKGNVGEEIAAKQMVRLGYRILEKNYRSLHGEIDIIASKDGYTVFTEVKYRKNFTSGLPKEAVNLQKQKHIIYAAKRYMSEHGISGDYRFDVAEIAESNGKKYFHYIENAFWA